MRTVRPLTNLMNMFPFIFLVVFGCQSASDNGTQRMFSQISAFQQASATEDYHSADSLRNEFLRLRPVALLITVWDTTQEPGDRKAIFDLLYNIPNDSLIVRLFERLANLPISEESYFANMYLAKNNDTIALARLDSSFWEWPVSSGQMSYTVELFGHLHYSRAIPTLIDALEAASMNLSGEALTALKFFYPDSPGFDSPTEAKVYFLKRWKRG